MYKIEAMTIQDYVSVSKLWTGAIDFDVSLEFDNRERIKSYLLRNPGFSSVAYHNDELVGTVLCGHDGRRGSLYNVVVSSNHRGKGIAKQMIDRSINCLVESGIDNGFLFVYSSNDTAKSFWNYNGWKSFEKAIYHYKNF